MTTADIRPTARPTILGGDYPMPDARDRVVGTIGFTVDQYMEGTAHGSFVRSQIPHGELQAIDVSEAEAMPGVLAVLTGDQMVGTDAIPNPYFGLARRDQPPLAVGKVRYTGEPVALVVADTPQHAMDAAELVMVDYGDLPYVVDPEEAAAPGAPVLHDDWPGNECGEWALHHGDVDPAMDGAAHVFESEYHVPLVSQVPFEPFVTSARWVGDELELWTATQWPSAVRGELAHMFGLDESAVRVRTFPLGGGYGAKSQVKIEPVAAAAARLVGVPVRLELDREGVFYTICRHAARIWIRTGVDRDGRFVARDIDLLYNGGAYAVLTPKAIAQGLLRSPGPYDIPNVRIRSRAFYTNTVPSGSFRGAMTTQTAFAYEAHTDEIAAGIGIDPVELRLRNVLHDGDAYATGQIMHDVHFEELVRNVAGVIGWDEPRASPAPGHARGKGVGVIVKTSPPGSRSEVTLELDPAGHVRVYSSSVDMGQGVRGTLAQLAAHHLGVAYEAVEVVDPDTSATGFDSMTAGSRTTFVADAAIHDASGSLLEELKRLAAEQLGVEPGDLEATGDASLTTSDATAQKGYAAILADAGGISLSRQGVYQGTKSDALSDPSAISGEVSVHWHQGAVAAEVDVDLETGAVELLRCHGAAWAGRVVNPTRARQQSEGSIIFGIGPALFEELTVLDGQLTNPNMSDYMIPSIMDVPVDLTSSSLESDDPDAELHGVGEMTIPAVAPAIANAVANATGKRIRDLPLTGERVLRALLGEEGREG